MNIFVCIKQVPATSKVNVDPITGVLIRDGVSSKMNPYDLFALETALRIKEDIGGQIVSLCMGPNTATEELKESFYMGVDSGILISDRKFAGADVLATAYTISQAIKKAGAFELIVCGKQTTDGDTAQVGPEVAEFLGIAHVANVCEVLEYDAEYITVKMNMDEYIATQKVKLPALITVDKDIYTPRLPSYKTKKLIGETADERIQILSLDDFEDKNEEHYGLAGSPTQVERIFEPEGKHDKITFSGDSEDMVQSLFEVLSENKFI